MNRLESTFAALDSNVFEPLVAPEPQLSAAYYRELARCELVRSGQVTDWESILHWETYLTLIQLAHSATTST